MTCSRCDALEFSEPERLAAIAWHSMSQSDRKTEELLSVRLELLSTAGELSLAQARIVELLEVVERQNRILQGKKRAS